MIIVSARIVVPVPTDLRRGSHSNLPQAASQTHQRRRLMPSENLHPPAIFCRRCCAIVSLAHISYSPRSYRQDSSDGSGWISCDRDAYFGRCFPHRAKSNLMLRAAVAAVAARQIAQMIENQVSTKILRTLSPVFKDVEELESVDWYYRAANYSRAPEFPISDSTFSATARTSHRRDLLRNIRRLPPPPIKNLMTCPPEIGHEDDTRAYNILTQTL